MTDYVSFVLRLLSTSVLLSLYEISVAVVSVNLTTIKPDRPCILVILAVLLF